MTYGDIQLETPVEKRIYYVYMWYRCDGDVFIPFYVGMGSKNRYRNKSTRSKAFKEYIKNNKGCSPYILTEGFAYEVARVIEMRVKEELKKRGYALLDGEDDREERKRTAKEGIAAMPIVNGRRVSAKTGNPIGRPASEYPDFENFLKMKKDGLLTVKEGCERLGISRSQWYALEKKKQDRCPGQGNNGLVYQA